MLKTHKTCCYKWVNLIERGEITQVLKDVKKKEVEPKTALSCMSALSLLIYNYMNKEKSKPLPPDVTVENIVKFSKRMDCYVSLKESKDNLRYFTSFYHIINYISKMNCLKQTLDVFSLVMLKKEKLVSEKSCQNLINPYVHILKNCISHVCSNNFSKTDQSNLNALYSLLIEFVETNSGLETASYLQIVHNASRYSGKDHSKAVQIIDKGLAEFYKVKRILNHEESIKVLFKIYSDFYLNLLEVGRKDSASRVLQEHLNKAQVMFKEKKCLDKCFLLLYNGIMTFTPKRDASTEKILTEMKTIVIYFRDSKHGIYEQVTCGLMMSLLKHLHFSRKQISPVFSMQQLILLSEIMTNVLEIIKDSAIYLSHLFLNICQLILNITEAGEQDKSIFKESLEVLQEFEKTLTNLIVRLKISSLAVSKDEYTYLSKVFFVRWANLIRALYLSGLTEECTPMAKRLFKFMISLPKEELSLHQSAFEISFRYLVNLMGTKKLDEALKCIVIYLGTEKANIKSALQLWGDLKHNSYCDERTDHLDSTFLKVLNEITSAPESEWPAPCFTNSQIANLLILELDNYFANKILRGTPVILAYKDLKFMKPGTLGMVKGLVIALDVVSSTTKYPDECESFYKESLSLLKSLRKEKANLDSIEVCVNTGNLLYTQLRCKLRDLRKDCECEMIRLSKEEPEALVPELPENRPDPNDTCNINTKFSNLSLAKQRTIIKHIDCVFDHWEIACAEIEKVEEEKEVSLTVTLGFLKDLGYLLRLYGDRIREEKTWTLLYNFGLLLGHDDTTLTAITERLNISDEIEEKLITDGRKLIGKNQKIKDGIKQDFYISTALNYLKNNKISEGISIILEIENQERNSMRTIYLLQAMGSYQIINEHIFNLSPSYHFSLNKAMSYLVYLSNHESWGSFGEASRIHLMMTNISRQLGEVYCALEQPREARCYLKNLIDLAQKLALPLKTAELLVVLGWVDLATEALDDCVVKMEGLESLLELHLPSLSYGHSPGSPPPRGKHPALRTPDYLTHPAGCHCPPCAAPLHRRLVLETYTLRAAFCAAHGDPNEGRECFKIALTIQENLQSSLNREVKQSCAQMWLRYADVTTSFNQYEEALSTKALDLIAPLQIPFYMQQIFHQKLTYESLRQPRLSPICPNISVNNVKTPNCAKTAAFKTPKQAQLHGKSPLTVKNGNIEPVTPFARPVRRLVLPSTNDENTPVIVNKTTKHKNPGVSNIPYTPSIASSKKAHFNIVDDDGNIVGFAGSMSKSTSVKSSIISSESSKKNLFSSERTKSSIASKTKNVLGENKNNERPYNAISEAISSNPKKETRKYAANSKISKFVEQKNHLKSEREQDKSGMKETTTSATSSAELFITSSSSKVDKKPNSIKTYGKSRLPRRDDKSESMIWTQSIKGHTTEQKSAEFNLGKLRYEIDNIDDSDDIIPGTPPKYPCSNLLKSKYTKHRIILRSDHISNSVPRSTGVDKHTATNNSTKKLSTDA